MSKAHGELHSLQTPLHSPQGAMERSQVFGMTLSSLGLQIFLNILVNIFLPKDQRRMAEIHPKTGSAMCAMCTVKDVQKH